MNAFHFPSLLIALTLVAGCIQEATDTGTSGAITAPAYTYVDGVLTISHNFNPYPGSTIGLFADGGGTEDGFKRAVATVLQSDEGDIIVNLNLFPFGADIRWGLATVDANNAPVQWLWESGVISGNLVENDPLGLTLPIKECVGDVMVEKVNFCTQITADGVMPGTCWGTYVEPTDCTDADNDGDVDPDDGTDTGDSGSGDSGSGECADADGDGFTDEACGGTDCDDAWYWNNPRAVEVNDNVDNNCNEEIDEGCEFDDAEDEVCD